MSWIIIAIKATYFKKYVNYTQTIPSVGEIIEVSYIWVFTL